MIKTSVLFACGVAVLSAGCSQEEELAGSDPTAGVENELIGQPIKAVALTRLGPVFATREGVATEAAAHALEPTVREEARRQGHTACVFADFGKTEPAKLSAKLVNLTSAVTPGANGTFVVTASSTQTYCAEESLDDARIVLFDGTLHALNPFPISGGTKVILDITMKSATDAVAEPHVVGLVPHLLMRFKPGRFGEVTDMPRVAPSEGAVVDVTAPIPDHALLLHLPDSADRIEAFFRFERWSFQPVARAFKAANAANHNKSAGQLTGPAGGAFVSNGGKNFSLEIR